MLLQYRYDMDIEYCVRRHFRTGRHNDELVNNAIQEYLHGDVNGDEYLVPINGSRNLQQRAPEHLDQVSRASVNR